MVLEPCDIHNFRPRLSARPLDGQSLFNVWEPMDRRAKESVSGGVHDRPHRR